MYLLKDITKLKKLRIESNLRKSDENDAGLLACIPREAFRQLTAEELEIKARIEPLIRHYEKIVRWRMTLKKLIKDGFDYNLKETIRFMKIDEKRISEEIIRQVANLFIYGKVYRKTCEILGVKGSTRLAILTLEPPLHLPLVRLKGLLGLIPGQNEERYYHKLRKSLAQCATNLYINTKRGVSVSNEVAEVVNLLPERQAIYRLQLIILKALWIAYLMTVKPLAGE
ncbi:MAG: hypothetical protein L2C94_006560 [Aigarchaeota archaeon]|nr:hypothetical protein [Candidatus Wolframiiraptor gerlachensis]